jgi:hypothetical protein
MKKNRAAKQAGKPEECRFDYRRAKANRFASRAKAGIRAVILDPDVAAVFSTPGSVNAILRALVENMPRGST